MLRSILLILVSPLLLFGQGAVGGSAVLTASGGTAWIDARRFAPSTHSVQLLVTSTPSACSFTLEGSLNGSLAASLSTAQDCTTVRWFNVVDKPARYVRGNLVTLTATTKTVTNCTNANPIEVTTSAAHTLATGDLVTITGVTVNTACNVTASAITVTAADKFTVAVAGNGVYGAGGTAVTIPTVQMLYLGR